MITNWEHAWHDWTEELEAEMLAEMLVEYECDSDGEMLWEMEREQHPERFVTVNHACGHPAEYYLALDEPTEADREKACQEEAGTLCLSCRPCWACGEKDCVCADPFADEEKR